MGPALWAEEHARFLHPDSAQLLATDEDLVALGVPFDQPAFFDKAFADLRSNDKAARARALRLLNRYVSTGPRSDTSEAWESWWKENQASAFTSEDGGFRWYVDPLSRKRGVPAGGP